MLLKLNLPEFFRILKRLQIRNICNKDRPALVLINGKIINKNGIENINLPTKIIIIARIIDNKIVTNRIPFDIFLLEVLPNQFRKK